MFTAFCTVKILYISFINGMFHFTFYAKHESIECMYVDMNHRYDEDGIATATVH